MYYFNKYPNEHKLSRELLRLGILEKLNERRRRVKLLAMEAMA
jgi:hypothetical protein